MGSIPKVWAPVSRAPRAHGRRGTERPTIQPTRGVEYGRVRWRIGFGGFLVEMLSVVFMTRRVMHGPSRPLALLTPERVSTDAQDARRLGL